MGAGLAVILLCVLILLLVPFIYFGIRLAGFPKAAIFISVGIFLCISIPLLKFSYRSQMYNKEDAIKDLEIANVVAEDNFRIIDNDISGFRSTEQNTILIFSKKDVINNINKIKQKSSFKISSTRQALNQLNPSLKHPILSQYYQYKQNYIVDIAEKLDEYTVQKISINFTKDNDTIKLRKEVIH